MKDFPQSEYLQEANYKLGQAYFAQNKLKEALESYQALLARFPDTKVAPQAQFKIGEVLFKMKRPADALPAFQGVIQNFDDREIAARRNTSSASVTSS